eukprot:4830687-Amphidinium_carterae.6
MHATQLNSTRCVETRKAGLREVEVFVARVGDEYFEQLMNQGPQAPHFTTCTADSGCSTSI